MTIVTIGMLLSCNVCALKETKLCLERETVEEVRHLSCCVWFIWSACLSVCRKKLSRLSCDNIVADDLLDFDIQYQVH